LPKAVAHNEALRAARAQAALRDWDEIVGEALAKRSRPDRYGRGVVWVAVTGSAWAQEMRMRKEIFLVRLRERVDDPSLFLDIRFGVRPIAPPEEEEPPIPVPYPAPRPVEKAAPEPEPEKAEEEAPGPRSMSIREIAQRRLARWKKDEE
jgi:hypothetical protein